VVKFAQTRCERPRPVIEFDAALTADHPWYAQNLAVPHEMAHVLVCLDGDPTAWADEHGEAWQAAVRSLLPRDEAEMVLAEQAALEDL
jgi:hypothetical protein